MDEGFILSNKFRRAIFDGLASGETNIERIAKKYRIIRSVAIRVADDFISGGILEKKGNKYTLTKEGESYYNYIKHVDHILDKWLSIKETVQPIYEFIPEKQIIITLCALVKVYNKKGYKVRLRSIFKNIENPTFASFIGEHFSDPPEASDLYKKAFKPEFILGCLK